MFAAAKPIIWYWNVSQQLGLKYGTGMFAAAKLKIWYWNVR